MEQRLLLVTCMALLAGIPLGAKAQAPDALDTALSSAEKTLDPAKKQNITPEMREMWKKRWQERQKLKASEQTDDQTLANGFLPLTDARFPKMLELAVAPEDKLTALVNQLPFFLDATPEKRERFLDNLRNFRNRLRNEALAFANKNRLDIAENQQTDYIRVFWTKRMEMEKALQAQLEPLRREMMKKAQDDLIAQFGQRPQANVPANTQVGAGVPDKK